MTDWSTVPAGAKLRCLISFAGRLRAGEEYEFVKFSNNGLTDQCRGTITIVDPVGYANHLGDPRISNWGVLAYEEQLPRFEVIPSELTLRELIDRYAQGEATYNEAFIRLSEIDDELESLRGTLIERLAREQLW